MPTHKHSCQKKGERYLPEGGDWALGIDATPFIQYAGNFFGKTSTNNSPGFNFLGRQCIVGKYFVDSLTAYRGGLRLGFGNASVRQNVDQLPAAATGSVNNYPDPFPTVENKWSTSATNIGLSGGLEMRRGKTRLQGFYGGELGIFFGTSSDKFTYGNALVAPTGTTQVNVAAADAFAGAGNVSATQPIDGIIGSARVTERKNGSTFELGVRGFIGAEYFILPKISIAGEFGWGLGLGTVGKTSTTWESIGNNDPLNANSVNTVGNTTIETPGEGWFLVDTDNNNSFFGASGSLRLNFHF